MVQKNYRFRPDWKTSVFVLVFLPVLISLGFWQLQREQEKLDILASHQQRMALPAVTLADSWHSLLGAESSFRRVRLEGAFLARPTLLLDNKIHEGTVGYQVIQPFQLASQNQNPNKLTWVNRGWVAAGRLRSELPVIETPKGVVTLQAQVYQSLGKAIVLDDAVVDQSVLSGQAVQPIIAQQFDVSEMQGVMSDAEHFPHLLRLEADSVGAYTVNWPAVNTRPEKHQAYAIQWFAMAIALFTFYLIRSIERENSNEQ